MSKQFVETSLVPFTDRVRGLQACRVVMVLVLVCATALFPDRYGLTLSGQATVGGLYLAVTALTLLAPRARRAFAVALFGSGLLADGVFLAGATYGFLGFGTPLVGLVLLHLVAVTLLGSFRTGLKIAVWHTLLMTTAYQLQESAILSAQQPDPLIVGVAAASLWLATLTTAAFASVNERELRRRNFDLAALARLSLRLEGSLLPADVADVLMSAVCEDQGVERGVLLGAVNGRLERFAGRGDVVLDTHIDAQADHMIRTAVASHRTLRVPVLDPLRDPWLVAALPEAQNLILLPVYADGAIAGLLVAEHGSRRGSRVERRVLGMLERYASHAALALNNARLLVHVQELADIDGLTKVANRRTFDRVLAQSLALAGRQEMPLSLVLVDIDHFKAVNDTYGHQVGDTMLQEVAAALSEVCRQSDTVARYGGEEFAVILPGASPDAAAAFAERLRVAVSGACEHPPVTASFGVAATTDGTAAAEWLIATADAALYRSKQEGRNRVTLGPLTEPGLPAQRVAVVAAAGSAPRTPQ